MLQSCITCDKTPMYYGYYYTPRGHSYHKNRHKYTPTYNRPHYYKQKPQIKPNISRPSTHPSKPNPHGKPMVRPTHMSNRRPPQMVK